MLNSFYNANKATLAAFGVPTENHENVVANLEEAEEDWESKTTVKGPGEVEVGDVVEFSKTITEGDVNRFALASGDTNPLHLNDDFASQTRFEDRIAHGTLVSGLISAALARLPGMVIYLSQDSTFLQPVEIGDRLTAKCEVVEEIGKGRYRLITDILDENNDKMIEGEAIVMIDELPEMEMEVKTE
ncbi:MAG: MaoC family dehydratase [Halobacteria archaeon]|nr:MaoC family dehydratase [Halobacteria archaeon]